MRCERQDFPPAPKAWALVVVVALSGCWCEDEVTITRSGTTLVRVCVVVADDADERLDGLRGRDTLSAGEGMLLVFPAVDDVCLTNEGVAFAIDAVFVDDSETVTTRTTLARDSADLSCAADTQMVLEVAEGVAREVRAGDVLTRQFAERAP
jgi:uncharacterized membrane protein (UPF0127 family)